MTAHKRTLSLILSVLLLLLLLGGCTDTPPTHEDPTGTTASVTAPTSTQTTLKTTTSASVTTTTTAHSSPSPNEGRVLTFENAAATFSLDAPTLSKNPVAYHNGKILFKDGANNTNA